MCMTVLLGRQIKSAWLRSRPDRANSFLGVSGKLVSSRAGGGLQCDMHGISDGCSDVGDSLANGHLVVKCIYWNWTWNWLPPPPPPPFLYQHFCELLFFTPFWVSGPLSSWASNKLFLLLQNFTLSKPIRLLWPFFKHKKALELAGLRTSALCVSYIEPCKQESAHPT